MEITVTPKKERSEVEVLVEIPATDFQPFIERSAKKLSEQVSLKGFRPGKAPTKLVMEAVGVDRILHEAMDEAIPYFFAKAAMEKELEVVHRPSISVEEIGLDVPFRFRAVVEVMPDITLADPTALSVKKRDVAVTDEQIDAELKHLAKMRAPLAQVSREAKQGDVATVDFQVKIDGVVIEGGESKNHPIPIGEGRFVPGFEEGLLGTKAGDDKVFPIRFPEDYGKQELQGKEAQVSVHVHSVQERTVPEIDDAFAKSLGDFSDLAGLKSKMKENMELELVAKEQERYTGELAEMLMKKSSFGTIPPSLIEIEIDRRMEEFANMLSYQQKTVEQYIAEHSTTQEKMRADMKESAEKQVRIGLVLRQLAQAHEVTVSEEEITEEVNKQLAHFKNADHAHEQVDPEELREYAASTLKNRKTLDLLNSLANKPS